MAGRKIRSFGGNVPGDDSGFVYEKTVQCDGLSWGLYVKHYGDWLNIKAVSDGRADRKANYWISYNMVSGCMVKNRDYISLAHRPELFQEVQKLLVDLLPAP